MADVLRSIHYGIPSTLAIPELTSQPTSLNTDFNEIYTAVVFESRAPSTSLSIDGAVLALVAILNDIHVLAMAFHPLGREARRTQEKDHDNPYFFNPHLPLSPANESREAARTLNQALDFWSHSYVSQASKDIKALFYFCRMYLSLPSLQLLPIMAGYPPRSQLLKNIPPREIQTLDSELEENSDGLTNAWLILENVESTGAMTCLWHPIVVFYASLVVWRKIGLQAASGSRGSLRVLHLFKAELEQMRWPCCATMSQVLEKLMDSR